MSKIVKIKTDLTRNIDQYQIQIIVQNIICEYGIDYTTDLIKNELKRATRKYKQEEKVQNG